MEALDPLREVRLPNVFSFANSASNDFFHRECKRLGITPHPARMPLGLASFFIEFLTDKGDLVLDPFAGSNTTGYSASIAGRRWVGIDAQDAYVEQSLIRFNDPVLSVME
jgi:site-specific DNA-methyltransferase (cytosine-N4-specific)